MLFWSKKQITSFIEEYTLIINYITISYCLFHYSFFMTNSSIVVLYFNIFHHVFMVLNKNKQITSMYQQQQQHYFLLAFFIIPVSMSLVHLGSSGSQFWLSQYRVSSKLTSTVARVFFCQDKSIVTCLQSLGYYVVDYFSLSIICMVALLTRQMVCCWIVQLMLTLNSHS